MHQPIDQTKKSSILEAVKKGMRVAEAATTYQVSSKTIYGWLSSQADNSGTSNLELAKLRRENQELKEIIGMFTLQKKRAEKNSDRS